MASNGLSAENPQTGGLKNEARFPYEIVAFGSFLAAD